MNVMMEEEKDSSNNSNHGSPTATSMRRPMPGQGQWNSSTTPTSTGSITNGLQDTMTNATASTWTGNPHPKPMPARERPSPGSSMSRPNVTNRSIRPEWTGSSTPHKAQNEASSSLAHKKIGTPEGMTFEPQQAFASPLRQRPSPGGFMMGDSHAESSSSSVSGGVRDHVGARRRPPSPGMGSVVSSVSKRPPSPGTSGSGLSTMRVPPSPGRSSPAPMISAPSTPGGSWDHHDSPATGGVSNHDKGRRPEETGDTKIPERQKSVRFDESPPKERFIFSSDPSDRSPPKNIRVMSSKNHNRRLPAPDVEDSEVPVQVSRKKVESLPEAKPASTSPTRNNSKKNDNPVRNNPLFLQKMAEAAESDSDDDDDEELKRFNATEKDKMASSSPKKLTGMAKMKKLAELSSVKDMSPLPSIGSHQDGMMEFGHGDVKGNQFDDHEHPVTFVDGPTSRSESKANHVVPVASETNASVVSNTGDDFSKAAKHLSTEQKTLSSRKKIMEGLKSSMKSQSSLTASPTKSLQENTASPNDPKSSSSPSSSSNSLNKVSSPSKENTLKETLVTNADKKEHVSESSPRATNDTFQKMIMNEKMKIIGRKEGKPKVEETEDTPKKVAMEETESKAGTNKGSSESMNTSVDTLKTMSVAERLEKRKLARLPVRQQSNSSTVSTGSKSTASVGKTRREILDKVKGRMSRSPSPSPFLQRHMMESPKKTVDKKTAMQKLIEARQNNFGKQNGSTSNLSQKTNGSMKVNANGNTGRKDTGGNGRKDTVSSGYAKPLHPLKSVSSLVSAPSDEKTSSIELTKSASSEHLSVQKGLSLVQKQNAAMKQLSQQRQPEKSQDRQPKEKKVPGTLLRTASKSPPSLAEKRTRQQEKERTTQIALSQSENSLSDMKARSREKIEIMTEMSHATNDDDDNFSIDDFPQEPSPSPRANSLLPIRTKSSGRSDHGQSQWAEIMEGRLKESEDPNQFNSDDNFDGESWSSDGGSNHKDTPPKPLVIPIHKKEFVPQNSSRITQHNYSTHNIDQLQNIGSIRNSFSLRTQDRVGAKNAYTGAYEILLSRSTNPLLVRVREPTLPSSLVTKQKQFLQAPEQLYQDPFENMSSRGISLELNTSNEMRSPPAVQTSFENEDSRQKSVNIQSASAERANVSQPMLPPDALSASTDAQIKNKQTETIRSPSHYGSHFFAVDSFAAGMQPLQTEPGYTDSNSPEFSEELHEEKNSHDFESSENTANDIQYFPKGEDSSYLQESLVESTLIGQIHVDSDDNKTDDCVHNQSIAEWWDKSYAHTQDDEVNSDIKQALSNSRDSISLKEAKKNIDDDSDDDVFFGLDEASPTAREKTMKVQKNKNERGSGHLDPIPSQDDSDFDLIMNGDNPPSPNLKEKPLLPPPPPQSTPPNRSSKKKNVHNEISNKTSTPILKDKVENAKNVEKTSRSRVRSNQKVEKSRSKKRPEQNVAYDESVNSGTSGEESYDDTRTFDDSRADEESYSSKSSSSEGSYTLGSETLESMSLNEKERRKWSDWEKKDHDTIFSGDTDGYTKYSTDVMERRARSHEQLLMHAYTALSRPPPKTMVEKGASQHPQLAASGSSNYQSDAENQLPDNALESPETSRMHRQELEKFSIKLKNSPFEVLKLNREKRWQTRFLTVSKEGTWLKSGTGTTNSAETIFCPLALLWVKRLTKTNDYSVTTIDKQGRGGMIFAHMSRSKIENEWSSQFPLGKKQAEKFKDSVIVRIYSQEGEKSSAVTFRCTKGVAEQILNGCTAVVHILRRQPLSKGKNVANHQVSDVNRKSTSLNNGNSEDQHKRYGDDTLNLSMNSNVPPYKERHLASQQYNQGLHLGRMTTSNTQDHVVVAKNYGTSGAPHLWEA